MRVAAVVVLYHPDERVALNIQSYQSDVEMLFIIDNSDSINNQLPQQLLTGDSVKYIRNGRNLGIAAALNLGASEAVALGFDYLLTMDQDSSFKEGQFQSLLSVLKKVKHENVGVLSPVHGPTEIDEAKKDLLTVEVSFTMTSGNLLNLTAFRAAGEFDASLFIDHVDHEYCFRLATKGYKVLVTPRVQLNHELGFVKTGRLLWMTPKFVSHSPVRTYYMIRNGLIVAQRYRQQFGWFFRLNIKLIFRELCKIPFESNKWTRVKLSALAFLDYVRSRTGKLEYYK